MATGVFFDIDGTLVDNSCFHTVAWLRACREFDMPVASAHLQRLLGMGGDQFVQALLGRAMPDLEAAHGRHMREFEAEAPAFPGGADLIAALHERGVHVGVVTSGSGEAAEASLRRVLPDPSLLGTVVTADDVPATKPAPDLVAVALDRSGVAARDAILIGDTGWDGEAARRCSVQFIGVKTGGWTDLDLRIAGATAVYASVGALLNSLPTSPLPVS